jgi:UDP-N-acetyl-D-glucosamine/UDP-N-acetyl-D-galactosamine dehydrogenase
MIKEREISIAVIGLGYVGLPLAVEFAKKYPVVGYDLNNERIDELKKGYDRTGEVNSKSLDDSKKLVLSSKSSEIKDVNIYIVTVPTPVDKNNTPNLKPLENASELVGSVLSLGDIVIYESTVYPGATEEVCIPILEKKSKLKYNKDFFCGYSPERINPGDKKHTLVNIKKITSGSNTKVSKFVEGLYLKIIKAGVFPASSIAVAEAAKVIENTQRDVNIALINELALIFNKLNIDTTEVLEAAGTKWNFLPFKPGLVGGHCIGVDPYYLTHKAVEIGYKPEIILAGRRINDSMGKFVAEQTILCLTKNKINPSKAKIAILGLTFKENCPDLRNTKVIDIKDNLEKYNCEVIVSDEFADNKESVSELNIKLVDLSQIEKMDALIIAVEHKKYTQFNIKDFENFLNPNGCLIDVKSIYKVDYFSKTSFTHWRL